MAVQTVQTGSKEPSLPVNGIADSRLRMLLEREVGLSAAESARYADLDTPVAIEELTRELAQRLKRVPLGLVELDDTFMANASREGLHLTYRIFKRTVDIGAALVLGAMSIPFLPFIAVAIKLDSPGPVIYRQTRLGMNNAHFSMCKFRTMIRDAEAKGAVYAAQNDPRVTRLGRFLRRTRIDEIPQIWNILKGDMSLIGPRPERPENLAMLEAAIPCFSARAAIRPGITGWAQASTVNYAATVEETSKKVEYDFYYLAFGRPVLDMQILVRTLETVLGLRGR